MDKLKILLTVLLSSTVAVALAEDHYQNSTNICEVCACDTTTIEGTEGAKRLVMDCTSKRIEKTLANWPGGDELAEIKATFSGNSIRTLQQFPGTTAKLVLTFEGCGIEDMETGLFESSINVVYFDISHNKIDSDMLSADVFKGPYNVTYYEPISLEHLNLAYNDIHTLHRNVFEHMPNLKYLNLRGNNFRVIDDTTALAFANVPLLNGLVLADNRLTEVSSAVLNNFKNLTLLDISANDLDFLPNSVGLLQQLEVLIIDDNPIVELYDETFLGLGNLLELSARNLSELTTIKTNTFAPCKKLKRVDLSANGKLDRIDEQAFLRSESLREFNLSGTGMNQLLPTVMNWATLEVLDLRRNQLYCECYLYNISQQLSEDLKRDKDGGDCKDVRNGLSLKIYSLTEDVCEIKPFKPGHLTRPYQSSPLLRMTLVILSVVAITSLFIVAFIMYTKWKSWRSNQLHLFTNRVVYNPITTNVHF